MTGYAPPAAEVRSAFSLLALRQSHGLLLEDVVFGCGGGFGRISHARHPRSGWSKAHPVYWPRAGRSEPGDARPHALEIGRQIRDRRRCLGERAIDGRPHERRQESAGVVDADLAEHARRLPHDLAGELRRRLDRLRVGGPVGFGDHDRLASELDGERLRDRQHGRPAPTRPHRSRRAGADPSTFR